MKNAITAISLNSCLLPFAICPDEFAQLPKALERVPNTTLQMPQVPQRGTAATKRSAPVLGRRNVGRQHVWK